MKSKDLELSAEEYMHKELVFDKYSTGIYPEYILFFFSANGTVIPLNASQSNDQFSWTICPTS